MKSLRFFVVAVLGLMLTTGLVACGSSDSGSDTYTASGTYDYVSLGPGTGTLTIDITSTTYPDTNCNGRVSMGPESFNVTDLTAATMTWNAQTDNMQWTGANNGDITGTWELAFGGITYYTMVISATDNTVTVTSPTSICSIP